MRTNTMCDESEIILGKQSITFHVQWVPCHHGMARSVLAVVEEPTDMASICECVK